MNYHIKKLLKGIIMFAAFHVSFEKMDGADGLARIEESIVVHLHVIPIIFAELIAAAITVAIALIMLYCFMSGMYRICTFHMYLREFE